MNSIRSAGSRLIVVVFSAYMLFSAGNASAAVTWQDVRSSMVLRGIATDGTLYVGAAVNGIWTSTDLKTWKHVALPVSAGASYFDVLWDGTRFIAVGNGVITSADGAHWAVKSSGLTGQTWNAIALFSGVYVVVGLDASEVLRSTDGSQWTLTSTGFNVGFFSYLNPANGTGLSLTGIGSDGSSGFVIMGFQYSSSGASIFPNADILATSPDGQTWNPATVPTNPVGLYDSIIGNDVAWNGTTYVAGGGGGVYTSTDGVTWAAQAFPPASAASGGGPSEWIVSRLAFANGQFIGVGTDDDTGEYAAFTSLDGVTWTEHPVATKLASFEGLIAIVPFGSGFGIGGDYAVYTSSDATTWKQVATTPETALSGCVVYGDGKFVVPGDGGSLTSNDGSTWPIALHTTTGNFLQVEGEDAGCAAFGNGVFVASSGFGGQLQESADGVTWARVASRFSQVTDYSAVAWAGNKFVAVGDMNPGGAAALTPVVLTSVDGKTWSVVSATGLPAGIKQFGTADDLGGGLTYGNNTLIAWGITAGSAPFIATSNNGLAWNTVSVFSVGDSIASVAYGNGEYMAIGSDISANTLLASSSDGVHWNLINSVASGTHVEWASLIWGNNEFVAGGRDTETGHGLILNSSDGVSWTLTATASGTGIGTIAWSGSSYVAASSDDIFELTPPASGGGTSGGGGSGGGKASGGGGGAFDILALSLLSGLAIRRRNRWMSS